MFSMFFLKEICSACKLSNFVENLRGGCFKLLVSVFLFSCFQYLK